MEKGKCRIKNVDSQLRYCPRPLEGRGHVTLARGDSNTLRLRRAPLHSGFSRKSREKRLEFRAGLYCNPAAPGKHPTRPLCRTLFLQDVLESKTNRLLNTGCDVSIIIRIKNDGNGTLASLLYLESKRTAALMIESFQNLISGHWQEILLVLIPILLIRLVRYYLHKRKMNKKLREEKELAARLMQDEALNDEILNPARREGDVEEKKYPYKVSYAENGRARRRGKGRVLQETAETEEDVLFSRGKTSRDEDFPGKNYSGGNYSENPSPEKNLYGRPFYGKASLDEPFPEESGLDGSGRGTQGGRPDQEHAGVFLKVEEHSGFSVKSYMYRQQEVMRVGNRYGKTDIIAGDTGGCTLYFEIFCRDGVFCVHSFGNAGVTIQRGKQRKSLGAAAVVLRSDDRIKVEDRVYVVSFVR